MVILSNQSKISCCMRSSKPLLTWWLWAEGLRPISRVQHPQCQIWTVCVRHWTLVEKVLHKCRETAVGTLFRNFLCSTFDGFCSAPIMYVWQGRIRESFQVITSHHCSCASHLCGLWAHLHWQEPDLCFSGRSFLLSVSQASLLPFGTLNLCWS